MLDQNYGTKDGSADASYKGRITVYKHLEDLPDTSKIRWLEMICQTQITLRGSTNQSTNK